MTDPTDRRQKTEERDAFGRFLPGNAGGPGRVAGSRNRVTLLAEQLMADDAEAVVRAMIRAALEGDVQAGRLILDRVVPPRRGARFRLEGLPEVETGADLAGALAAVVAAMAAGTISPEEAATVAGVLEVRRKVLETEQLEQRVAALEERTATKGRR